MVRIEVVIDPHIVLIAIGILAVAICNVHTFIPAEPPITGYIQPIAESRVSRRSRRKYGAGSATREIVRMRHFVDEPLNVTRRVELSAVVIPRSEDATHVASKDAQRLKRTCRIARSHRVSIAIDGRGAGDCVAALNAGKESEVPLTGLIS